MISVDNEDLAEKPLAYIASKVIGPVGTIVTLGLKVGRVQGYGSSCAFYTYTNVCKSWALRCPQLAHGNTGPEGRTCAGM